MADDEFIPDEEFKPDAPQQGMLGQVWDYAKQLPLGIARGATNMVAGDAPRAMAEAMALNPRLAKQIEQRGEQPPTPEQYREQGQQFLKDTGVNSPANMPQNLGQKAISGAGEALPWGLMGGTPGMAGNLIAAGAGGAGGVLAEEMANKESDKPYYNIAGNIIGSFGAAGALRVANSIINSFRPHRTLPGQFNLPATRGMIEQDPARLADEELMRNGAYGVSPQRVMHMQDQARQNMVRETAEELTTPLTTPEEAGSTIQQGLRTRAEDLRSRGDALFARMREKNPWAVANEHRPELAVDDALTSAGFTLDNWGNYPTSQRARTLISRLGRGTATGDEIGPGIRMGDASEVMGDRVISLNDMYQMEKRIGLMRATNREDGEALRTLKTAYTDWMMRTMENAIFSGDRTAIQDLNAAKPLWRRYRQMTDADPQRDYSRMISNIIEKDRTPEEVANWLTNISSLDGAAKASRAARYLRQTFGAGSNEYQDIRNAVLFKVLNPEAEPQLTQRQMARNIERAFNGPGSPLTRTLFNAEERATLMSWRQALIQTSPPPQNPQRTASTLASWIWPAIRAGAGIAGAAGAYGTGDWRWIALGATPLIRDYRALQRAIEATRETRHGAPIWARTGIGAASGFVNTRGDE